MSCRICEKVVPHVYNVLVAMCYFPKISIIYGVNEHYFTMLI